MHKEITRRLPTKIDSWLNMNPEADTGKQQLHKDTSLETVGQGTFSKHATQRRFQSTSADFDHESRVDHGCRSTYDHCELQNSFGKTRFDGCGECNRITRQQHSTAPGELRKTNKLANYRNESPKDRLCGSSSFAEQSWKIYIFPRRLVRALSKPHLPMRHHMLPLADASPLLVCSEHMQVYTSSTSGKHLADGSAKTARPELWNHLFHHNPRSPLLPSNTSSVLSSVSRVRTTCSSGRQFH